MKFLQSAEELSSLQLHKKQFPNSDHDEAQTFLTHEVDVTIVYILDTADYIQVYVEYPKVVLANGHGDAWLEINSGFKNAR